MLRDCESKLAASNLPQAAAAPDAPQALPGTGVVGPRRSGPLDRFMTVKARPAPVPENADLLRESDFAKRKELT